MPAGLCLAQLHKVKQPDKGPVAAQKQLKHTLAASRASVQPMLGKVKSAEAIWEAKADVGHTSLLLFLCSPERDRGSSPGWRKQSGKACLGPQWD